MSFVSFFLTWTFINNQDQIEFLSYSAVDVSGLDSNNEPANRETLTKELNELAIKNDSIIARRIVEPNKAGKISFVYQFYGNKKNGNGMVKASESTAETSDLVSNYLIIQGKLDRETLLIKFNELGYIAQSHQVPSIFILLTQIIIKDVVLLSIIIFMLTFCALTIIESIKDLRSSGIRLISGESFFKVMFRSFFSDVKFILSVGVILFLVNFLILLIYGQGQLIFIMLSLMGILMFSFLFLLLSFLLSFVYLIGLHKDGLVELLKGKLPLNRILSIMIIGQLLSIVTVGWTLNKTIDYSKIYKGLISSEQTWAKNNNQFILSYSQSSNGGSFEEASKRSKIWYDMANKAVENRQAMLVSTNLKNFISAKVVDGFTKDDYVPSSNTIYVTPNYLINQKIKIESELKSKLLDLKQGEFGLLLPHKLKENKQYYIDLYTKEMQTYGQSDLNSDSKILFEMNAITGLLQDNSPRFLFNTNEYIIEQQLEDPIIVVVTPKSMGDTPSSHIFWDTNIGESMLFEDYDRTVTLLNDFETYPWISYITNGYLKYLANTSSSKLELLTMFVGSVLGIFTASLLFFTMNILYFEKFRRDIFIKRISGMTTLEIHQIYLLTQFTSLVVASFFVTLLTKNILIAVGTSGLFFGISLIILWIQIRKENNVAITVLKGK